jgi:hypothetical protein
MRPYLRNLLAVGLAAWAATAAATPKPADGTAGTIDAAPQLSALDSKDPDSPETLNGRLAYALHLVDFEDADCGQRADAAQRQLDIVAAKPAFLVVMPLGAARAANIEYGVHAVRAGCGADPTVQQRELSVARDAALRAADFYRDGFDYQSMVVMQFDAAVAARRLGDSAGAEAMLRSAAGMDEAYGFQKDRQDNQALLAQWAGGGPEQARDAGPAQAPTAPSATLKFAWSAKDADVAVTASYASVVDGQVIRSQAAATRALSIRSDGLGWAMSFPKNLRRYDFGQWPQGRAQSQELMTLLLANIRLTSLGIRVSRAGDFRSAIDPAKVSTKLSAETKTLAAYVIPQSDGKADPMPNISKAVKFLSTPDEIADMAAEDYDLTTAAWIGAKLDQGVWYDIVAPMREPGTADTVDHDIHFAFTRKAPCGAASASAACVEIVLHAAPDPSAIGRFKLPSGQAVHYWSTTDMRIVTDADSLLPYVWDVRRYWYFAVDGGAWGDPVINSERIVSTFSYR